MRQIRQNVFETNSSSTHSICIAKTTELTIPNEISFDFGEFGWEVNTLNTMYSKASYLYTGLVANNRLDDVKKIIGLLEDEGINVSATEPNLKKYSYQDSNGKTVEYVTGDNIGYINHENQLEDFLDDICEDKDKLMRYLFSGLSFVLTGNDNYDGHSVNIDVDYPYDEYYKGN